MAHLCTEVVATGQPGFHDLQDQRTTRVLPLFCSWDCSYITVLKTDRPDFQRILVFDPSWAIYKTESLMPSWEFKHVIPTDRQS